MGDRVIGGLQIVGAVLVVPRHWRKQPRALVVIGVAILESRLARQRILFPLYARHLADTGLVDLLGGQFGRRVDLQRSRIPVKSAW